ncbi:MAG: 4-hydroxy-tetrahydrodipicolinate reductase [Chitinophagaceae bacterium]|nr:4-hydroxy-tetrahydrodipicolinate reductase [Chitinophagaceae bacterium]MCW5904563.1 4-hydroxy-tetrahydrodipicolinate reductase [Chitinophagaceae bacterium]
MKIALIGYGKMGKAIEEIALAKGHTIVLKITSNNVEELTTENIQKADIVIEFTNPHSAVENITKCLQAGVPVICGSTGWLHKWNEIELLCKQQNGTFLFASNFSIGVNLFFELNIYLAKLMSNHTDYNIMIEETHHTQKKDAPSGTAITLAEQILQHTTFKENWVNHITEVANQLPIISKRIDAVTGTHKITYTSAIDDIEIIHTAHNRMGFAKGAILAAEFVKDKKGIITMKEVLGFKNF